MEAVLIQNGGTCLKADVHGDGNVQHPTPVRPMGEFGPSWTHIGMERHSGIIPGRVTQDHINMMEFFMFLIPT